MRHEPNVNFYGNAPVSRVDWGNEEPSFYYCEVERCLCLSDGVHKGHRMCGHHIWAWRRCRVKLKDLLFLSQDDKLKWINENAGKRIDDVVDKTYYPR